MRKEQNNSELQVGIHPIESLLEKAPANINHIVFLKDSNNRQLYQIQKTAEALKIKTHQLPQTKLDYIYKGNHQGVIAFLNDRPLDEWGPIKERLLNFDRKSPPPYVVLATNIEDPRNFGAIIRSSLGMGCNAVLFTSKGSCGLTASAAKASAGASSKLPVCSITDTLGDLEEFKQAGYNIIGLDGSSRNMLTDFKTPGPLLIIIGGEDKGIPPHISRICDRLFQIPILAEAHSYNASVALSLMLYEVNRFNGFNRLKF